MKKNNKLKLFIAYSHQDEKPHIEQFRKHIEPLKDNGLMQDWYDRKITAGDDYQNKIDNNLEDADIIGLFISVDFLSSDNCKKERDKALELRTKKGIRVIPIILSPCGWLEDKNISKLLVLPQDGKPITSFQNSKVAWHSVYADLKKVILEEMKIKQLTKTQDYDYFLQDTEMLKKAHPRKERVHLKDIFVNPDLEKYDDLKEYKETVGLGELLTDILNYPKLTIAGEDQSGKTSLCKVIIEDLINKNFVPIYVSDKDTNFAGKIENRISNAFTKQYKDVDIGDIDIERIVPIIDDFHLAKDKEKHINDLAKYSHCILVVDDIFSLNIKDEELISSFDYFRIKELKPSLRYKLIKKWMSLVGEGMRNIYADNHLYHNIDSTTELIDSTLGKTIGRGIMPSYPFFILSTIVTYETFSMPLDQEITSQGYCYQAFIYFYLRKEGVRNDEIDTYINFLSELAYYLYRERKSELSPKDFSLFMKQYLDKYNLPIKNNTLLNNLCGVILNNSFNNYSFKYPYLYYFFVAKYLSEHIDNDEVEEQISKIVSNLHVEENAYIAIFISHHSNNVKILEEIELNALCLFEEYKPAKLTRDEVEFFDKQLNIVIKAALPQNHSTPEKARSEQLEIQDKLEKSKEDIEEQDKDLDNDDSLGMELRRAIKTVEVMGNIIKNRAGSLERKKIEDIYMEAMDVHLRILFSFFEAIKSEEQQKSFINFISDYIEKFMEEEENRPSKEKLEKISRIIFWNLSFLVVFGVVNKIVHSLGSDKLTEIIIKVCDQIDTPASFIVKHGILMWYNKNVNVNEIAERFSMKDFSEIAKRTMKFMIVEHCSLHSINYKDRQRLNDRLDISVKNRS